jgi:predicted small secreted protein
MRKFVILAIMAAGLALTACNTIAGMGQDLSAAGHATTDTARDAS